jgi:regulator of protease activity HflC (stomatin/prohibitin superfamily)
LNYSWILESIEERTYTSGRYYLGLGNSFIKFPQMVRSVYFVNDDTFNAQGPAVKSRTRDGLNVHLEVSFQYRLMPQKLYDLYLTLGEAYESVFIRIAVEQLTTQATMYTANEFFDNRTVIGPEMHSHLQDHFLQHCFADVPFFQLRTVHLPEAFETAIQETQVKQPDNQVASAQQSGNRVQFQTLVLQAEQDVKVLLNQADGEASAILAQNEAYVRQYNLSQGLQVQALGTLQKTTGWNSEQLLEYMRIKAVRDHPSEKTTLRL